jgi:glycosyltransferase involved in cell wall biosynthesis
LGATQVLYLSDRIAWFGGHSGYEPLPRYVRAHGVRIDETRPASGWPTRIAGRLVLEMTRTRDHSSLAAATAARFWWKAVRRRSAVKHVLYAEEHLAIADRLRGLDRLLATFHLPPRQWKAAWRAGARRFDAALVLYTRDLERFEEMVGRGRVRFVHLGADTEFFTPGDAEDDREPRIVLVGHWLRDVECAIRAVRALAGRYADLRFDVIMPSRFRDEWAGLAAQPGVQWHEGLADEELRAVYRRARCLLIPMRDSGASTAMVDALACGLPPVTTDVGGIRDYGGASVFPVARAGDADEVVELAARYVEDRAARAAASAACREFAARTLGWEGVARRHIEAYRELFG